MNLKSTKSESSQSSVANLPRMDSISAFLNLEILQKGIKNSFDTDVVERCGVCVIKDFRILYPPFVSIRKHFNLWESILANFYNKFLYSFGSTWKSQLNFKKIFPYLSLYERALKYHVYCVNYFQFYLCLFRTKGAKNITKKGVKKN